MIAMKCDRCKKYYDRYDGNSITEGGKNYNSVAFMQTGNVIAASVSKSFDLCPNCMAKIIDWIKAGDK